MTDKVKQALEQGYVYFIRYDGEKVRKGFIEEYKTPLCFTGEGFSLAYGVKYFFNWREDLYIENCEELIKDIRSHELYKRCYNCGFITQDILCDNYGLTWALTKEELE